MQILASGNSTAFCVSVRREKKSDPSARDVLERISSAVQGAMPTDNCVLGSGNGTNDEANNQWRVPEAYGEVLASRLNLVSTPRRVSYNSVLDAISAASRA
ncbi:MAG: hypothetical protein K1060chlam4_00416 [Candidatus Anoxychlamydiales bacterium]|nr:hypothetical protein [Candidatus Anoxychlamydiales bacterium]